MKLVVSCKGSKHLTELSEKANQSLLSFSVFAQLAPSFAPSSQVKALVPDQWFLIGDQLAFSRISVKSLVPAQLAPSFAPPCQVKALVPDQWFSIGD